jgi:Flp pilus assembly protein CpaB
MKNSRIILIIIAGVILVVIGVFASFSLIQRMEINQVPLAAEEDAIARTNVVVTTRDLNLGDRLGESDVEILSVPVEIAPRTAITDTEEVIGMIIKTNLVQGEMILSHNLADPTNNVKDLNFILADDHVLMAFPAEDLMSQEDLLKRGDLIDIFATFSEIVEPIGEQTETDEEVGRPVTRNFTVDAMQMVNITALVLEVVDEESGSPGIIGEDGQMDSSSANIKAILLALDPLDALILKHLKDIGAEFDLVLRAPTSSQFFNLPPVSEDFIVEYYGLEFLQ